MPVEDSQLYRDLMRLKPDGWTANAWAVRAGVSRTVWSDMRRHGNPSRRTLEKLLGAAGSSLAEFEALRVGEPAAIGLDPNRGVGDRTAGWRGGALPPLPLIASSTGGTLQASKALINLTELRSDLILEQLPRPVTLSGDPGAYAFAMVSDCMWPRFRRGRHLAVSPAATVSAGDDVLLTVRKDVRGTSTAFVAELVDRSHERIDVRQFNPAVSFSVSAHEVVALHKIVGELI